MLSLYQKALKTEYHSRFVARAEDLGRELANEEVRAEAQYYLENIDYSGLEETDITRIKKQLVKLMR